MDSERATETEGAAKNQMRRGSIDGRQYIKARERERERERITERKSRIIDKGETFTKKLKLTNVI